MKKPNILKRILALITTLVMLCAGTVIANAEDTYTVTINNAISGITYDLYKIFDYDAANDKYTIDKESAWVSVINDYIGSKTTTNPDTGETTNSSGITLIDYGNSYDTYSVGIESTFDMKDFAAYLDENKPDGVTAAASKKAEESGTDTTTLTLSVSETGYYLLLSDYPQDETDEVSGVAVTLEIKDDTGADVYEKNSLPSIEKTVNDEASTTASVGDTVEFKINVFVNNTSSTDYIIADVMEEGLTLDTLQEGSLPTDGTSKYFKVELYKYNTTTNTYDDTPTDITDALDNFKVNITNSTEDDAADFVISIDNDYIKALGMGDKIVITYEATVNTAAAASTLGNGNTETNKAKLYQSNVTGNDPTEPTGTSKEDTASVSNYGFELVKTDENDNILTGATFKLYSDEACTTEIKLVYVTTDDSGNTLDTPYYRPATQEEADATGFEAATITAGDVIICGLADGTYYLNEITPPTGYNRLTTPTKVEIADKDQDATFDGTTYQSGGIEVENRQGTSVPTTGGAGTKMLYALGGIMLIGAWVFLITKKKMSVD